MTFSAKRPDETETFAFDFARLLATGETLSLPVVKVVMSSDQTETAIPAMISGAATVSGSKVVQKITGGEDGITYTVLCTVTTSTGQVLVAARDLPVRRDQT